MPPKNSILDMFRLENDPFTELELDSQVLESLPVQRATVSTETGAEAAIQFPDNQLVDVTILGQAVVTIEIPTRPKPEPVNVSIISVILK